MCLVECHLLMNACSCGPCGTDYLKRKYESCLFLSAARVGGVFIDLLSSISNVKEGEYGNAQLTTVGQEK